MLDYAQTFEEFSSSLKPMDLALYAGAGIILWVVFKEKLSPVQKILGELLNRVKGQLGRSTPITPVLPAVVNDKLITHNETNNSLFFQLVTSWKQTRDLAVKSGCSEAVKVADQMFPYLSPTVCQEEKV